MLITLYIRAKSGDVTEIIVTNASRLATLTVRLYAHGYVGNNLSVTRTLEKAGTYKKGAKYDKRRANRESRDSEKLRWHVKAKNRNNKVESISQPCR